MYIYLYLYYSLKIIASLNLNDRPGVARALLYIALLITNYKGVLKEENVTFSVTGSNRVRKVLSSATLAVSTELFLFWQNSFSFDGFFSSLPYILPFGHPTSCKDKTQPRFVWGNTRDKWGQWLDKLDVHRLFATTSISPVFVTHLLQISVSTRDRERGGQSDWFLTSVQCAVLERGIGEKYSCWNQGHFMIQWITNLFFNKKLFKIPFPHHICLSKFRKWQCEMEMFLDIKTVKSCL